MTVDEIIAEVHAAARGRTRYEGQALRWDEALVAEIGRLRSELAKAEDECRTVARVAAAGGAENVKLREFILRLQAEIRLHAPERGPDYL